METGNNQFGHGFSPEYAHSDSYPASYSSGISYRRAGTPVSGIGSPPPPSYQESQYQQAHQFSYPPQHPEMHPEIHPMSGGYTTGSFGYEPTWYHDPSPTAWQPMENYSSARGRRPSVHRRSVYIEPEEDAYNDHQRSHRPRTTRPRTHRTRPRNNSFPDVMSSQDIGEGSSARQPRKAGDHRPATVQDAKKHGIPPTHDLKYWDPDERPIYLLGSIFDANSLGKWIFDGAVKVYGPGSPLSQVAGNLWLQLIQLYGCRKKIDGSMQGDGSEEDDEMLQYFVNAGNKLMSDMWGLLRACEESMQQFSGGGGALDDGSDVEFVRIMFGRDNQLEEMERTMRRIELWVARWKEQYGPIVKRVQDN